MTTLSSMLEPVVELIRTSDRFLICSHEVPEGDCLGASLGLYHGLRSLGKEAFLLNPDGVPPHYTFLPGSAQFRTSPPEGAFGAVFVVDCGAIERLGRQASRVQGRGPVINLDHHPTNTRFGALNVVAPWLSSSGELIFELLARLEVAVDADIAWSLYAAIVTDTGSFRYSNTSARTFEVARILTESGAHPAEISTLLYEQTSLARMRLMTRTLETLRLAPDGQWASMQVTLAMFEETGTGPADVEGLINLSRALEGVRVALLFRETRGGWAVSLRSKGRVDISAVAVQFGGGGHRNAAGCYVEGPLEPFLPRLIGRVEAAIADAGGG